MLLITLQSRLEGKRDRFRHAYWPQIAHRGLVPVTIGLILCGGTVMARAADTNWQSATVTMIAAALILWVRVNPLWILIAAGAGGRPRSPLRLPGAIGGT